MKLGWEFYFPNNTDMSEINCMCTLLITIFLCSHLHSYCLLCALVLSMWIPHIQIHKYFYMPPYQHRSQGPIFMWKVLRVAKAVHGLKCHRPLLATIAYHKKKKQLELNVTYDGSISAVQMFGQHWQNSYIVKIAD